MPLDSTNELWPLIESEYTYTALVDLLNMHYNLADKKGPYERIFSILHIRLKKCKGTLNSINSLRGHIAVVPGLGCLFVIPDSLY